MVAINREDIAKSVQDLLNDARVKGSSPRVMAQEIRPGGDQGEWWWVPVEFAEDSTKIHLLYELFAEVEERLEEQKKLNVLLVPRKVRFDDNER